MEETTKDSKQKILKVSGGFLNPAKVKAFTFYTITTCVILSVIVSILAIWDFAQTDAFWRMIATFAVIGLGSAIFAFINNVFGSEK